MNSDLKLISWEEALKFGKCVDSQHSIYCITRSTWDNIKKTLEEQNAFSEWLNYTESYFIRSCKPIYNGYIIPACFFVSESIKQICCSNPNIIWNPCCGGVWVCSNCKKEINQ